MNNKPQKKYPKPLKDLTLLDRFLFNTVVSDPDACRKILSIILDGQEIPDLRIGIAEYSLEPYHDSRSVRLDLLAFDENDTVYNTEAQKENKGYDTLCRRSRYYQSHIDVNLLKPGEIDFGKLNDVYVIFISPFDLFGKKKYRYTFRMQCEEIPGLTLKDGATRIFLNTHGQNPEEVPAELVEFLNYVEHTSEEISQYGSSKVKELAHQIDRIKQNQEVGVKYMQLWEEMEYIRRESRDEGKIEGITTGETLQLIRLVHKKLDKNLSISEIADILEENEVMIQTIRDAITNNPDLSDQELAQMICEIE